MADNYMTYNDAVDVLTPYAEKINTIKPEPITWAAYQLLTSEQKAAKRYLITDYPSPTGYVNRLSDLEDVSINSQTLSNGQVPVYNSTNEVWENKAILENSLTSTATDVALTAAQGKVLQDTKQAETLATPLTINGVQETTVEGALGGLNDYGDALADNLAANEESGAKNKITYPYEDTTKTDNGITFTDNGNGSVTVSGTASGSAFFYLHDSIGRPYLENGEYTLSGCPQFGSTQQMRLYIVYSNPDDNTSVFINQYNTDEETTFTINGSYGDTKGAKCSLYISIVSGTVITTPITFYPMIRDARIIDPTFAPFAETNLQLTKDASGLSNRNLIDNPYFTVNQREATTITGGYGADRWTLSSGTSATFSSNGVTLANYTQVSQSLENILPNGRYTLSIKLSDGTIVSGTNVKVDDVSALYFVDDGTFALYYYPPTKSIVLWVANSVTIRAVKLELGSVSTLANDVEPNYTTELLKCQRYFERVKLLGSANSYALFGMGYADSSAVARVIIWCQPKRALPALSFTGNFYLGTNTVTGMAAQQMTNAGIAANVASSGLVQNNIYVLVAGNTGYYIDLSADL